MAIHPSIVAGLNAWQVGPSSHSAVFAASHLLRQPDQLDPDLLKQDWERRLGGPVTQSERPALQEGWRAWMYTGRNSSVFEQARVEGSRIYRVGWYTQRAMAPPREVFYEAMLRTVRLSEPAELRSRREAWSQFEKSPQRTFEYGEALEETGRYEEALALFARLETNDEGWEWESTRARFRICSTHPRLAACGGAWREDWLKKSMPEDVAIRMPALRWLVAEGRCPEARRQAQQMEGVPEMEPEEVEKALSTCETPR